MKKAYDAYGITMNTIDNARAEVERALAITFEAHESEYLGGDYFRAGAYDAENFVLQSNYISSDDAWMESAFCDTPFLLYVSSTLRSEAIQNALEQVEGIKLLKHQEI